MSEIILPCESVEYRDIPGYEGYRAGSDGSIWTRKKIGCKGGLTDSWRKMNQRVGKTSGRMVICFKIKGKVHTKYVHRLVLSAFSGECHDGLQCCHNDGNPFNNTPSNLRWDTQKGNEADKLKHGTRPMGEKHYSAKLSDAQIADVRSKVAEGVLTQKQIGDIYGIDQGYVSQLANWKRRKGNPWPTGHVMPS